MLSNIANVQVLLATVNYNPGKIHSHWEQQLKDCVQELCRRHSIFIPYEAAVKDCKIELRLLNVPLLDWYREKETRDEVVQKMVQSLNELVAAG